MMDLYTGCYINETHINFEFIMGSRNDHLPVGLMAQVAERCTCIAEVSLPFPVRAEFFRPFLLLLK